jgi:hypothetical protein
MLIGIVADIHDAVTPLRTALARFREAGVEQVVTLGDAFEAPRRGEAGGVVAGILRDAGAIGVWGNHDAGLSGDVPDYMQREADPVLLAFASRLEPQIVVENCRFSHIEHWLNPATIEDLWHFDGMPDSLERASLSFNAVTERLLFMGHYHRWLVVSSDGTVRWDITQPLVLAPPDRHLVVLGAVVDGWCATFDSITATLTPIRCDTQVTRAIIGE